MNVATPRLGVAGSFLTAALVVIAGSAGAALGQNGGPSALAPAAADLPAVSSQIMIDPASGRRARR